MLNLCSIRFDPNKKLKLKRKKTNKFDRVPNHLELMMDKKIILVVIVFYYIQQKNYNSGDEDLPLSLNIFRNI